MRSWQLPQPVPARVWQPTAKTVSAPSSTAAMISASSTAAQMQANTRLG